MRGLIILIFSMPIQVFAWNLFGPDNYDDCVLEKLKGESNTREIRYYAQKSCDRDFPQVKEITNYSVKIDPWSWSVKNGELYFTFAQPSEYVVTSVKVHLMKKACDAKYANLSEAGADYYLVDVNIVGGSECGKTRVRVPDGGFHCASVEKIHGTNRY